MKQFNSKRSGYYTVEAAFIMTICLWVVMALCYSGLYIHDQMMVKSEMREILAEHFEKAEEQASVTCEKEGKEFLKNHLFLARILKVKVKKKVRTAEMTLQYELPISLKRLKNIFLKGQNIGFLTVSYELVQPANYKWDYDIPREGGES